MSATAPGRAPFVARWTRRRFVGSIGGGLAALSVGSQRLRAWDLEQARTTFPVSKDQATDLTAMSAIRLAQMIRDRKVSAQEVVKTYLARIAEVNPRLNAVVQMAAERALAEAKDADALLAKGRVKGPWHGVPMTIKDSFDTAGIVSTGGTLGRKSYVPGQDATVVARLRAAGAILVGKTNTPEFTLGSGGNMTTNLVYGLTRNPYNPNHHTGGSSGGAAAIVAAGGAAFDLGSDFGGSIRLPAHACGIAGLKPTSGRVPRSGHIIDYGGAFDSFQQIGPLARRVEDLALILPTIAGPDSLDAAIAPVPLGDSNKIALKGLRAAYYTTNGEIEPTKETQEAVRRCAGSLKEAGVQVTEAQPPQMKEARELRDKLQGADGRAYIRRMLQRAGTTQASPGLPLDGLLLKTSEFTALVEKLDECRVALLAFLENYDLIVCPVSAYPARPIAAEPDARDPRGVAYSNVYNITGWPVVVVRAGTSPDGLPIGVQIVAQPWREDVAIAAAAHLEVQTGGWQPPPARRTTTSEDEP